MAYYNPRADLQSTDPSVLNPVNHIGQGAIPGTPAANGSGQGAGGGPDWDRIYGNAHSGWAGPSSLYNKNGINGQTPGGNPVGGQGTASGGPVASGLSYADQVKQLQDIIAKAQAQQAPQSTQATLGPAAMSARTQLSPAQQAAIAQMGPAAMAQAQFAGPAAQSVDNSQFTGMMTDTAGHLQKLMAGQDSVAATQAKLAANQQLGQQASLAASASPSNALAARRIAGQNMAQMGGALENNQLAAQQAERTAATNALGQLSTAGRGQDLQNSQFNAGETNTTGRLNATLGTNVNMGNAQQKNQVGMFNTGQQNQGNMFNTGEANTTNRAQGALDQQNSQFNVGQGNDFTKTAAGMTQQNNQYNTSAQQHQSEINNDMIKNALGLNYNYNSLDANNKNTDKTIAGNLAIAQLQHPGVGSQLLAAGGGVLASLLPSMMNKGGGNPTPGGMFKDWGNGGLADNWGDSGGGGGGIDLGSAGGDGWGDPIDTGGGIDWGSVGDGWQGNGSSGATQAATLPANMIGQGAGIPSPQQQTALAQAQATQAAMLSAGNQPGAPAVTGKPSGGGGPSVAGVGGSAIKGAGIGATVGSAIPVIGTGIGAAGGAIVGGLGNMFGWW